MDRQGLIIESLQRDRSIEISEGAKYDLSLEDERRKACDEYSECEQNILSSGYEDRMRELDKLADKYGLKFHMTNKSAYSNPRALVKPKYILVKK